MELLPQSRKWANSVRLKDFPTLSGLFLPEQSWGKEEERRFGAAKAGFLTFCQHMLPSLLKSSQFRTPANATKALCLAQCSGLHEQGTAAPHTCSCTGLTSAAPHPWQACANSVPGGSAHGMAALPKGSPEPIPGKQMHQENLLDFRNITHSKQTPSALAFTMNSWLHWNNFAWRYFPPLATTDKDSGLI